MIEYIADVTGRYLDRAGTCLRYPQDDRDFLEGTARCGSDTQGSKATAQLGLSGWQEKEVMIQEA